MILDYDFLGTIPEAQQQNRNFDKLDLVNIKECSMNQVTA